MRNWKTSLLVGLFAVAAVILFAQPDKASAAPVRQPASVSSHVVDGSLAITTSVPVAAGTQDDVEPLATYTLSRTVTQQLWAAWSAGGLVRLVTLCLLLPPGLNVICAPVMGVIAAYFANATRPNGRCLQITTRIGLPPVSVRYVTCP
jgi:hypothetical protein